VPNRATDRERASREAAALELLSSGAGSAYAALQLAERYGVSLRQARRYVAVAALELVGELTPHALDVAAGLALHRLSMVAGRAMLANDDALAVRASRAEAAAIAQIRRAIEPGRQTRFRLPTQPIRARPEDPPEDLPF
jgi:hypothetical protein